MSQQLSEIYPPFGLRITCGDLVLRGITDADIMPLVEVARRGVHDKDEEHNPLGFDWTAAPPQYLAINYAKWAWGQRVHFTVDSWILALLVEHRGRVVGVQEGKGEKFRETRTISTGSWLGQEFQGQGIGTLMRQVYCAFAFDHLDATLLTSAAFTDNPASHRVSQKLGYRAVTERQAPRGTRSMSDEIVYHVTAETLVRPAADLVVEGMEPLRRYLGLDGSHGGTAEVTPAGNTPRG